MSLSGLIADLTVDKVMALSLALEHYRVSRAEIELEGLTLLQRHATLADGSRKEQLVELLVSDDFAMPLGATQLRHLAGVSAMRLALGAACNDWRNDAERKMARLVPDGLWERSSSMGRETWAIEYDANSYWGSVIHQKARAFHDEYDGQIWGCWNGSRVERLRQELHLAGVTATVIEVHWWGDSTLAQAH